MALDFTEFSALMDSLTAQADKNTTVEGSAGVIIQGIPALVQTAVMADDTIDKTNFAPFMSKLTEVTTKLAGSEAALGAIVNNTPAAPPVV